jgi:hypothetical protein
MPRRRRVPLRQPPRRERAARRGRPDGLCRPLHRKADLAPERRVRRRRPRAYAPPPPVPAPAPLAAVLRFSRGTNGRRRGQKSAATNASSHTAAPRRAASDTRRGRSHGGRLLTPPGAARRRRDTGSDARRVLIAMSDTHAEARSRIPGGRALAQPAPLALHTLVGLIAPTLIASRPLARAARSSRATSSPLRARCAAPKPHPGAPCSR